jgi:hypothetical protein
MGRFLFGAECRPDFARTKSGICACERGERADSVIAAPASCDFRPDALSGVFDHRGSVNALEVDLGGGHRALEQIALQRCHSRQP